MPDSIQISETKDHFIKGGKNYFLLGDTLWTAFCNITLQEWADYLDYRQMQGFNMVCVNILHQWDSGKSALGLYPYHSDENGIFDFSRLDENYFDHGRKMVEMAHKKGVTIAMIVLHASYVKGTWASVKNPNIMPLEALETYVQKVIDTFDCYDPIYIISGDTNCPNDEVANYYMTALKMVKKHRSDALCTMHLLPNVTLHEAFHNCDMLDFYMLQPGHSIESASNMYSMPMEYFLTSVKKPMLNAEYTYEGHGYGHENFGRYDDFNIRKGMWQSLLSGAKCGIVYGAHGLWGWYRYGTQFANEGYGGKAFPWQYALRFKGAWDAGYAKWLFELYELFDIEPRQDLLLNENTQQKDEIRVSASPDVNKFVIYIPYSVDIKLVLDLKDYECVVVKLDDRTILKPVADLYENCSVLRMYPYNSDALIIGRKNNA